MVDLKIADFAALMDSGCSSQLILGLINAGFDITKGPSGLSDAPLGTETPRPFFSFSHEDVKLPLSATIITNTPFSLP